MEAHEVDVHLSQWAVALQRGGPDAYGMPPERRISDGDGVPCRHCLRTVAAGKDYLVLAYRPFPEFQPYAETLADRARAHRPRRILETAAGTGVVTEALHRALPDCEIVATDLNQPMLDVAAPEHGLGGLTFTLRRLDTPYVKDYDAGKKDWIDHGLPMRRD